MKAKDTNNRKERGWRPEIPPGNRWSQSTWVGKQLGTLTCTSHCSPSHCATLCHTWDVKMSTSLKLNYILYGTICTKQLCVHSVSHNLENICLFTVFFKQNKNKLRAYIPAQASTEAFPVMKEPRSKGQRVGPQPPGNLQPMGDRTEEKHSSLLFWRKTPAGLLNGTREGTVESSPSNPKHLPHYICFSFFLPYSLPHAPRDHLGKKLPVPKQDMLSDSEPNQGL